MLDVEESMTILVVIGGKNNLGMGINISTFFLSHFLQTDDIVIVADPCSGNPCANGGECSQEGTTFTCKCQTGFHGEKCHRKFISIIPSKYLSILVEWSQFFNRFRLYRMFCI